MSTKKYNYFNLEEALSALEAVYQEHGFVTHALVGKRLGLSRQCVQINLAKAMEDGRLAADYMDKFVRRSNEKVTFHLTLSKDQANFMNDLAASLKVRPQVIVETALELYRDRLRTTLPTLTEGSTMRSGLGPGPSTPKPPIHPSGQAPHV